MSEAVFKDKFVGFVDILGFKDMIEASEEGRGRPLSEIREILVDLANVKKKHFIKQHGPETCPHSARVQNDLDFEITQVSDCMIVSSEISPASAINIVSHCWAAAIKLLTKGIMVRGYITRGEIYHSGSEFYGTGYHSAYKGEGGVSAFKREADEKGTPFIEVDSTITKYIADETDECARTMFDRMVKRDGVLTALFPFQRLSHSFLLAGVGAPPFDPEKEKTSNNNLRNSIHGMKDQLMKFVEPTNADAMKKVAHYIAALNQQLEVCDQTDSSIDCLARTFRGTR